MNRLGSATSPYLRQHADNPVHWREWDAAALGEAAERDVPILLSIGYASCHWCHVMAHESFEDEATAALMNEKFVCIKVDREERPDLDAVYMNATVAMTGQGGWPMTCFLMPTGEPFYCGTYYPKTPRHGMPSFTQLLTAVDETWRNRRDEVNTAAAQVGEALRQQTAGLPDGEIGIGAELLDHAVGAVLKDLDSQHGGFGGAPKFPPSALLEGLLRHYELTGDLGVLQAVSFTCEAMARGGIYDQLRGGFARYSVDAAWVVPHFEKMLYDNAQLLRVYAHLARRAPESPALRVTRETVEFLLADLGTEQGAFASALDADTHLEEGKAGVEGATYVWTPAELNGELGALDGAWAAELFGVTTAGTFEHGTSVLTRYRDPNPADHERFEGIRDRLSEARSRRPQPERDDKVVTAWNGMAIVALAEAGAAHGYPEWIDAAARCARHLLDTHVTDGRVCRASLGGVPGSAAGVLEDYAWLALGLLALHQTAEGDWLSEAQRLLEAAITHFADPETPGSWFDTADDAETLLTRPRDPLDGATPSGTSVLAEALLTASALADTDAASRYRQLADLTLARGAVLLARAPRSAGHWLAVAEAALRGPIQVAVAEAPDSESDVLGSPVTATGAVQSGGAASLLAAARLAAPGGSIIVSGAVDSQPLLADRPPVRGTAAAYICRGSVCDLPVTSADDIRAGLLPPAAV